ncbi:MAG: flagellar biosynthesis protein FlhB, partial [Lachnospiraceae bacterium]|nr:flagellar biosynthesis protein FlhB [Lachnospiraceae bacterium]
VVSLFALFLLLRFWTGHMGVDFLELFQYVYSRIPEFVQLDGGTATPQRHVILLIRDMMGRYLLIMLPIFLIGVFIAFITNFLQFRWMITFKPMKPKFSKLNPVNGFKRFFSIQSVIELIKSVAKLLVIFYIAYSYLVERQQVLFLLLDMPVLQVLQLASSMIFELGIRISAVFIIIAAADFLYTRFKWKKDMKMTKQEVKDEMKETEGDPQIKGKQRQRMREASQRRMMQQLPQADVVITNPTHYAVAIQYDADKYEAPMVIAKGEGYIAARIKEVAAEHGIEIVENKPLARVLYANVEIGELVPPELYQAVAEVLAFVYHLQGKV